MKSLNRFCSMKFKKNYILYHLNSCYSKASFGPTRLELAVKQEPFAGFVFIACALRHLNRW